MLLQADDIGRLDYFELLQEHVMLRRAYVQLRAELERIR